MKTSDFFSKIIASAFVTVTLCAFCGKAVTLRAQELILGEVSGDGNINSIDASMVLQIANGLLTPGTDQLSAADADQDGTVTSADAEIILQCAAEKCRAFTWQTIGPGGGTLHADDLTITIPPGTFSEEANIAVKARDPYPIQYENLDPLGSFYQLEHFPKIQEPITIEIFFDQNVIAAQDSVYIYQEQESFITEGGGEAESGHPRLDTQVDSISGKAAIQIAPYEVNAADVSVKKLINPGAQQGAYQSNGQDLLFSFAGLLSKAELLHVEDNYFIVADMTSRETLEFLNTIKQFLNEANNELANLGFSLTAGKKLPVEVYITNNLISSEDTVPAESVRPSYPAWQAYYAYMNIKPGFTDTEYKIFAGHELFHIVQWLYGAYSTISSNYQYLGLLEASSTWFEAKLSQDGMNYFSQKARDNSTFIYAPLETDDEDHGYGASSFLTYLTDQSGYGDGLIFTVYQKIKNGEDNDTGTGALQAALGGSEQLSELFCDFAFKFISKTTGYANWPEPSPPPGGEVQLSPDQKESRKPSLSALSAWNVQVNSPQFGSPKESYQLIISLKGGNQFIKGAVYARDRGSSTWQWWCEFSPGETCEVRQFFGSGARRSANVILVNQQAEYPYNQVVPVTLTFEVKEQSQNKTIVGTWDVTKYDYLCQGFPEYFQTGKLHIFEDYTYAIELTEDSFEGTWLLQKESALSGSLIAYFYSNGELKFQGFVNATYDEIHNDWYMTGPIVCVHAEKVSDIP